MTRPRARTAARLTPGSLILEQRRQGLDRTGIAEFAKRLRRTLTQLRLVVGEHVDERGNSADVAQISECGGRSGANDRILVAQQPDERLDDTGILGVCERIEGLAPDVAVGILQRLDQRWNDSRTDVVTHLTGDLMSRLFLAGGGTSLCPEG